MAHPSAAFGRLDLPVPAHALRVRLKPVSLAQLTLAWASEAITEIRQEEPTWKCGASDGTPFFIFAVSSYEFVSLRLLLLKWSKATCVHCIRTLLGEVVLMSGVCTPCCRCQVPDADWRSYCGRQCILHRIYHPDLPDSAPKANRCGYDLSVGFPCLSRPDKQGAYVEIKAVTNTQAVVNTTWGYQFREEIAPRRYEGLWSITLHWGPVRTTASCEKLPLFSQLFNMTSH